MEPTGSVGIFVEIKESKPRFELTGDLLFGGVGELDSAIFRLKDWNEGGVFQGIKRKRVNDSILFGIDYVVDSIIQTTKE